MQVKVKHDDIILGLKISRSSNLTRTIINKSEPKLKRNGYKINNTNESKQHTHMEKRLQASMVIVSYSIVQENGNNRDSEFLREISSNE